MNIQTQNYSQLLYCSFQTAHRFCYYYYEIILLSPDNQYNILIAIWLKQSHPYHCPMVFVTPTPDMGIQQSQFVDNSGKVHLPYLTEWKQVLWRRMQGKGKEGRKGKCKNLRTL